MKPFRGIYCGEGNDFLEDRITIRSMGGNKKNPSCIWQTTRTASDRYV